MKHWRRYAAGIALILAGLVANMPSLIPAGISAISAVAAEVD